MRTVFALLILALTLAQVIGCAAASRHSKPVMAVALQVQHTNPCPSCAERLAAAAAAIEGVKKTQAIKGKDSAWVFYEDGAVDLDDLKTQLARQAGLGVKILWGPSELTQQTKALVPMQSTSGFVPTDAESLPVQRE